MEQIDKLHPRRLLSSSTPLLLLLCFSFFFIMISVGNASSSSTVHFTNETDRQTLLAIKEDLIPGGDSLGAFISWNNHSIHFCNWQGVTCGGRRHQQRVTVLNLSSLALVGSLSPHIGNLTFLRTIDLGNNSFHGEIPPEIGRLFRLRYLSLKNNSFRGEFPTNLTHCSHLRVITVSNNNLGGKIPTELGSLSNLSHLYLSRNHLTGTIPLSIGNLSSLRSLSLGLNNLKGSIPFQLARLSKLEMFLLAYNNLSGMVPTLLYNMSSISVFELSGNQVHGSLPPDLGSTLPELKTFSIHSNQFYGPIPSSIANASGLSLFDFADNSLTGPLPMTLGILHELQYLNIWGNKLGEGGKGNELMNFLTSLSNCSNLLVLDLSRNHFKGLLHHSISNLSTKLTWLNLESNYISGSIPLGVANLVNLDVLSFSYNLLTGSIPVSIGKLSNLKDLYIHGNNISGEVPSSIANLTWLGILHLGANIIVGNVPGSLGNCTGLLGIYLGYNHLTGAIPQQIFGLPSLVEISLEHNYLTGVLPLQLGNLKNLVNLELSENKLSGQIPSILGSCQVLQSLDLHGNLFQGTIPASFQQLRGIEYLDVSSNNLSGHVPRFLGELTFLQNLNLSHNMFDGEVPNEGVFRNISAFSVVGNNKLCGGIKILQLPACPTRVLKEKKWPFSRRVTALVITLIIFLLLVCLSAIFYRIRRPRREALSASPLQNQYLQLSYGELLQATNGFSSANLIGQGRYGSVFKGILKPGIQIVAVKILNLHERGANKSFIAECEALRNIRHRNLVKIITSCSSIDFKGNDFKALVYEFMTNGSLERWLHPSLSEQTNLNFIQRLNVAIDVASALDYLHHHCERAIVHCDLKPSNILLDDDFCAHVGDFGLTRILSATTCISNHQQSSSIGIRGTIGYVAPEYGMGEEVSTQGDMYSYGVLLLEMFTGKRPTDSMFTNNVSLHSYAKVSLPDQVTEIVEPRIILNDEGESSSTRQSCTTNISKVKVFLVSVLQIGVSCSAELPRNRMNARDVLMELQKIRNVFLGVSGQGHHGERRNDP